MPLFMRPPALFSLIVIVLSGVSPAVAQDRQAVDLPVDWKVGEKHRIEMTKEKERYRNGARRLSGTAITPVDIEVLRKLPNGYVVRWTYGKTRFVAENVNPLTDRIANIIENMRLDMRTDTLGSVTALLNGDDVRAHYKAASAALVAWMKSSDIPQNAIDRISRTFTALSTSKIVEVAAVREPSLFYLAFGGSYQTGEALEFDDLIANPWGQEPIPTKAKLFLKQIDLSNGTATIGWKQVFDREKAGPILEKSMKALGIAIPQGGNVFSGLSADDDGLWIFDTKSGWLLSGSWQRATTFNGTLAAVERIKYRTIQ